MIQYAKTLSALAAALAIVGGAFFGGIYVGQENRPAVEKLTSLAGKEPEVTFASAQTDFSPFWKAWNVINEKYVPPNGTSTGAVTEQDKVWGAIEGLIGSLGDPYSVFLPPADSEIFEENISGNFGGVGIEIGIRDDLITVISPLKGTPAFSAGMLEGDKIIEVDGESVVNASIDEAVKRIRGEVGTPVVLTVLREGKDEPLDIEIIRGVITIPTIETELRDDDGIFVIELINFSAVSPDLFRDSLREFVLSGSSKLVLDLRGNAGGFLQAAVDIASWFLPAGKTVVVEDYGGKQEDVVHRSKGYDIFNENLEMVVLINEGSASASEILAGALSEHGVATTVGAKTFGKGSVQELVKITPDTSLKVTVAHWKTPKGLVLSKSGLTPEIEVERTIEDREEGRDPQFDKAVELLTEI